MSEDESPRRKSTGGTPADETERAVPSAQAEETTTGADQTGADQTPTPDETTAKRPSPFPNEAWGATSRAVTLLFLLGMALCAFVQLSWGNEWVRDYLRRNELPMGDRMALIYWQVGCGALLSIFATLAVLLSSQGALLARRIEGWSWFVSPLMLLPAVPVVMSHQVWRGNHEDLLPVVLFGALICEVLVGKALVNVPPIVSTLLTIRTKKKSDPQVGGKSSLLQRGLSFVNEHPALILVVVCAVAYGAFMSFYTIRWHNKLGTATFDLGINNNLMYGGLEGKFNQSPVIFPDDPQKYLANHVKIGLYAFLPLYALFPRPEMLLSLQSISLGLGALPLFLFAKKRIPANWAAALSLCYLAYYPLHGANFYEMKVVPTAAAVVLLSIWAIDDKRYILGGLAFAWALIMREDLPVPLAVVGACFLLSGHRPVAGAVMASIASVWFVLIRFRFMNEVGAWWFPNMYEDLWAEPEKGFSSVIKTLVSNPTFTLQHIFVKKKFWYMMHLLVPLAFLPTRRWYGWAALVPGAILTLLVTDYSPPLMFSFQYVMHWAPYMFIAAAVVLGSMVARQGRARGLAALVAMCLTSAALTYNFGAFSLRDRALESGYHRIEFGFSEKEAQTLKEVRALVASIPAQASVASTERIGAHLSSRSGFYTLRRGSHGVQYMVARKKGLRLDRTKETIYKGLSSGEYGVEGRYGDFIVFKKGASTEENQEVIREWRLSSARSSKKSNRKRQDDSASSARQKEPRDGPDSEPGGDDSTQR